jgi:hypothetical protein
LAAQTLVANADGPVGIEESAQSAKALQEFTAATAEDTTEAVDEPSDIVLDELDELRGFFSVLRSEFDALKQKVESGASVWADAIKPVPVDQEVANVAQMNALLGIDQPSPLDIKEAAILAAVEERIEAPMAESEIETVPEKKMVPRGVFLILAFAAIVGGAVLVITQL